MPKDIYHLIFLTQCKLPLYLLLSSTPLNLYPFEWDYHRLFIAFKLNSTPTNVAAYISVLDLPSLPQQSASLCLPNDRGMEVQHEGITHISRESPSHSWSETFPERSNSICGNQLSSTIEETGVCPLRSGLKSGFDSLVISLCYFFSLNFNLSPPGLRLTSPQY
jgi:hypothetical protein